MGGLISPSRPAPIAATPVPPTATPENTSAAVTAQATPQGGRAANMVAGPDLNDNVDDAYSVRKRLLGQ